VKRTHVLRFALVAATIAAAACAPGAGALRGAVEPVASVPLSALRTAHELVVFNWEFRDDGLAASGEGAARLAAPDSARLDLALAGGMGGAQAFVFGDSIRSAASFATRLIPPAALFWGAVGRLAIPPGDTTVRRDGDTLRAEIRRADAVWRVAFAHDTLQRIEHIVDGRIVERVDRGRDGVVRYRHLAARRSLDLTVTRRQAVPPFDAAIWPR
jgi:hypothetical protein